MTHLRAKPGLSLGFRVCVRVRTTRSARFLSTTRRMQRNTALLSSLFLSFFSFFFLRIFTKLPMRASSNSVAVFAHVCERGIYLFSACLHREDVATVWCYWHLWNLDILNLFFSWLLSQFQSLTSPFNKKIINPLYM